MKYDCDVIIVGGGPSGLSLARRLAGSGLETIVLEKKSRIGENIICTGVIGRQAFSEFDLSRDSILTELQNVNLISPHNSRLTYSHPEPFAYVVNRESFDRNLAKEAESSGARIELKTSVRDIEIGPQGVKISAQNGRTGEREYFAPVAVLATGVDYRLHKKVGLGTPRTFINGAQVEIEIEPDEQHLPSILVGKDVAPGAFAWAVPITPDRVRVGLVTEQDPSAYMKKLLHRLYPGRSADIPFSRFQYKAIAQSSPQGTCGERLLAVGEAAGQVKTTTGGGVYFGLICAEIAADVLLQAFSAQDFSFRNLSCYDKAWKKAIQRELTIGYFTRKVCGKLGDADMERLFQIARVNGVFPLIRSMGRFDWHSDLLIELAKKATVHSVRSIPVKIQNLFGRRKIGEGERLERTSSAL